MKNNFYTYIYLDPRKPGNYIYGDFVFDYEPIYVGKGRGYRLYDHLTECNNVNRDGYNTFKYKKMRKILNGGYKFSDETMIKIEDNLTEYKSSKLEVWMIWIIGRMILNWDH